LKFLWKTLIAVPPEAFVSGTAGIVSAAAAFPAGDGPATAISTTG
jgi:hypothetical protein